MSAVTAITEATEFDAELTEFDLKREYTEEERDALLEAAMDAFGVDEEEKGLWILSRMPIHPRWAKIIADVMGKEYLLKYFNVTHANEIYGEDWLNDK